MKRNKKVHKSFPIFSEWRVSFVGQKGWFSESKSTYLQRRQALKTAFLYIFSFIFLVTTWLLCRHAPRLLFQEKNPRHVLFIRIPLLLTFRFYNPVILVKKKNRTQQTVLQRESSVYNILILNRKNVSWNVLT